MVSWGRSHKLASNQYTFENQRSRFIKSSILHGNHSELRKIKSIIQSSTYPLELDLLLYGMIHIPEWNQWIEEDQFNQVSIIILSITKDLVYENEDSPAVNVVNWGRSIQLTINYNTWKSDISCHIEWFLSCSQRSELRKIKSINQQSSYYQESKQLDYRMISLLEWMFWIEEDQVNQIIIIKPSIVNFVTLANELSPVVNVLNWGRSIQLIGNHHTSHNQSGSVIKCTLFSSQWSELRKINSINQ